MQLPNLWLLLLAIIMTVKELIEKLQEFDENLEVRDAESNSMSNESIFIDDGYFESHIYIKNIKFVRLGYV